MTLKNSVRHVWRSFAIRLFTGIYKCSKCLHFEKKICCLFSFFLLWSNIIAKCPMHYVVGRKFNPSSYSYTKVRFGLFFKILQCLTFAESIFFSVFFSFLLMCLTKSGLTSQIIRMYIKFPIFSCIICPGWWILLRDSI